MADALTRVQIFFNASGAVVPTGWTETYYSAVSDMETLKQSVRTVYVPARKQLLGFGAVIQAIRVGKIPPTRITKVYYTTGKEGQGNIFDTPEEGYDPTSTDMLIRMESADGHRRQMWLSALPDEVTDTTQENGIKLAYTTSPQWKTWVKAIVTIGLGIRFQVTPKPEQTFGFLPITDVIPVMIRKRSRGRPFFLFRGRKSV